jgi:hypothetical protein
VDGSAGNTEGRRRLDLKAAAAELGVTSEAIRRRAKRGTLPSEKGEDGLLYVWLPDVPDAVHGGPHGVPDDGSHAGYDTGVHGVSDDGARAKEAANRSGPHLPEALLERYEDENGFLRQELERLHRELERKDAILLTMAQRIPELEAAPEPRESPETPWEQQNNATGPADDTEAQKPSWWRRLFVGE